MKTKRKDTAGIMFYLPHEVVVFLDKEADYWATTRTEVVRRILIASFKKGEQ